MRHKTSTMAGLAVMLLLASACGSSGVGDIFGGGNSPSTQTNLVRGTVDHVDANNRSIVLRNVSGYNSMLSNSGSGSTLRVYYDNQTEVQYQGQDYRPTDLEAGDEVEVRVNESGSQLVADTVTVTRNVGGTNSSSSYPAYGTTLRGTVRYIDTSRGTIELDRGSGTTTFVEYPSSINVMYNGSSYRVADLERGDEIEIRATDLGSNRFRADSINVIRSVSSNDNGTWNGGSTSASTIRGTVRYIDTTRRTIELESTTGSLGFNTNASTIVISYPTNATVDVSGRSQPITGLERGDVIEVQVDRSGSSYMANRIWLVRDIRQ
jgi:hypothetical protein